MLTLKSIHRAKILRCWLKKLVLVLNKLPKLRELAFHRCAHQRSLSWLLSTPPVHIHGFSFSVFISRSTSVYERVSVSRSVVSDSLQLHGLYPARLLCPWNSPDKNTGVGCHSLLRGIFPTQGSNLCLLKLLHCRQILYYWATREAQDSVYLTLKKAIFGFTDVSGL